MSAIDAIISQLMPSSSSLIGLDIGASSIKVCEVNGNKVEKFYMIPLSEAAIIEDEIQKTEEIVAKIKRAMEEAGIRGKNVAMGLQGPNTLVKRMQVPEGNDDEVEDHILWESEQYIPFGADDSQISHFIIGENEGGGKDVVLTAAREDTILSFEKTVETAGYQAKVVEISSLSLSNLFEHCYSDKLKVYNNGACLIDFGAQSTKIVIYRAGAPIFCKEILIGGVLVTEEIQRQMGVSYEEAEDLKINGDQSGNLPEEIMTIVDEHLAVLFEDVKKSLNFFMSGSGEQKLEICLITGGHSRLPGLAEGLKNIIDIDVNYFDAFRKFKTSKLSEEEKNIFSAQGMIALGLSLRSL